LFGLSGAHPFVPVRLYRRPARGAAVKADRLNGLTARRFAARSRLECREHVGRLVRSGRSGIRGLRSPRVIEVLSRLVSERGAPRFLRSDNVLHKESAATWRQKVSIPQHAVAGA
jgi:hypothetical protein